MIRFGKSQISAIILFAVFLSVSPVFAGDYSLEFTFESRGGGSASSANYDMDGAITFNAPMASQSSANYQTTSVFDIHNPISEIECWMLY